MNSLECMQIIYIYFTHIKITNDKTGSRKARTKLKLCPESKTQILLNVPRIWSLGPFGKINCMHYSEVHTGALKFTKPPHQNSKRNINRNIKNFSLIRSFNSVRVEHLSTLKHTDSSKFDNETIF